MKAPLSHARSTCLFSGLLLICTAALAQQAPNRLPPAAEPGRELRQQKPLQPVPDGTAIAVPEAPAVHPPAGADQISFTLSHVSVEGSTLLSPAQSESYYSNLIGHVITVADVFAVAAAIENDYRNQGYVTSRALVPEQQIENGAVRIVIIEGFIAEITYAKQAGPARAQVERMLAPLRGVKPINISEIERRLLLVNDLHGIQVRGTLQPSANERGGSTLIITAERDAFDLGIAVDNRNSPFTGRNEGSLRSALNSFTAHAATISLQGKSAAPYTREHFIQAAYEQSIGGNGFTTGLSSFYAESRPGLTLIPLEVYSKVVSASASAGYPLIRSRLLNLRIDGSFDYSNLDTNVLNIPYTRDRLRVLRLGMTYDRTDSWHGVNAGRIAVSQGLDILGASPPRSEFLSRFDGRSEFTKITAQFARIQTLTENFSVLASFSGQISWDSLLASEQIGLGGAEFGRAYDISEVSGDKGIDGVLELRYQPPFASPLWNASQFFVYYDLGKVWNVGAEFPDSESLASAGAGLRLQLPGSFSASLEVAKPLTHIITSEQGKPTRVFFTLATHF